MWPGRHVALFDRAPAGVELASQRGPLPALESLNATQGQHDLEQLIHALAGSQGLQGLSPRRGGASGAGAFLAGFLFCAFLVAAFWYRLRAAIDWGSKRRRQKQAAAAVAKMEPEELRSVLGEVGMPAWANLPDFQRVAWLNAVLARVWPYAARMVTSWAEDNVTNMLQQSKPPWMRSIRMHHFTMGTQAPEATGVKVYGEGRGDEAVLDVDFMWTGDQEMVVVVKPVPRAVPDLPLAGPLLDMLSNAVVVKASIERWVVSGRLRIKLRPLLSDVPIIGGVQVSLVEVPRFSFDLSIWFGELAVLPGLESWLHALIRDSVFRPFVLPERYTIPFIEGAEGGVERPQGLLEVQVVEAQHVPRLDVITASDPYVKLFVRSKHQMRTQVRDNTSHPRWGEEFQLLVHYPDTQQLVAVLYDHDAFDADDEVGRVEVAIRELPPGQEVDEWYEVVQARQQSQSENEEHAGQTAGPISLVATAGQKTMSLLTRPWEHRPLNLFRPSGKSRAACQLHLKLKYTAFDPADVDAALRVQQGGSSASASEAEARLDRMDPRLKSMLQGGVLYVRVKKVEALPGKSWLLGGWKRKVKVKAELGGNTKWTAASKGKKDKGQIIDQELEFLVDGEQADKVHNLHIEVWDVHWRNELKGWVSIPFQRIKDSQLMRGVHDLRDVGRGRILLELQWLPAFTAA